MAVLLRYVTKFNRNKSSGTTDLTKSKKFHIDVVAYGHADTTGIDA
jgi:hypothetical protein